MSHTEPADEPCLSGLVEPDFMSHTEPADELCLSGLVEPDSHTISTMQETPDSLPVFMLSLAP